MAATERLQDEHGILSRVLAALEGVAGQLERGEPIPRSVLSATVEFLRAFDRGHHGKEEEGLFPVMHAHGAPLDVGPIAVMTAEHAQGRQLVDTLAAAYDGMEEGARAGQRLSHTLRDYVTLLRNHIAKEDNVLFPWARALLSAEDERHLAEKFSAIDQRDLGEGMYDRLVALAAALERVGKGEAHAHGGGQRCAADVMPPAMPTVRPEESLARASELMLLLGVRELPVVCDRMVVGILAQRDVEPHRGHLEWTQVRTAMTPDPVTVTPETPAALVAQVLLERCINAVPVARAGAFMGMVARSDLLGLLLQASAPSPVPEEPGVRPDR